MTGRRIPIVLLFAVLAAALALNFWARHHIYFFYDEYDIVLHRYSLTDVLEPTNGHPVIMWLPIYYALRAVFGLESALPFQIVGMLAFGAAACVLFVYLRIRAGAWIALAGTTIVLFLGSGSDILFWPFQLSFAGSIGAGLGALVALERDRRLLAAALLVVSVFFMSLGLAFVAAAGVAVAVSTGPTTTARRLLERLAVVVGPAIGLFLLWYLTYGNDSPSRLSAENIATTPKFAAEGIANSAAVLSGLAHAPLGAPLLWGFLLVASAILIAIWRLARGPAIAPQIWIGIAGGLAFWVLTGVNQNSGAAPDVGRYDFVGVVFAILVLAELVRGFRPTSLLVGLAAALVAVSVVGNFNGYRNGRAALDSEATNDRVVLGALEIARGRVEPEFRLDPDVSSSGFLIVVDAGSYFKSSARYGSPALSPDEILGQSELLREHADRLLIAALRIHLVPASADRTSRGCIDTRASRPGDDEEMVGAVSKSASVRATGMQPAAVLLRRFANNFTSVGTVPPGGVARISIPPDRSKLGWKIQVKTPGSALVCRG